MPDFFIKAAIEWTTTNANWLWLIPLVSGLVGWFTNVLALKMMFYPLQFKGFGKFGWQGIIPARSTQMATTAVDLMLNQLIDLSEQFHKIDPKVITKLHKTTLQNELETAIDRTFSKQFPLLWLFVPEALKKIMLELVKNEIPLAIERTMTDIQNHIEELLDVKAMVIQQLELDKHLLNQIFLDCGQAEFKFIERSGFYFGLLFGSIQMIFWYYFQYETYAWCILPIGGLLIGFLTNWLALQLIFYPRMPIRVGNWTIQGLFLKRQQEVAKRYAQLVAHKILTTEKIFNAILHGSRSAQLRIIIEDNIMLAIQRIVGVWGQLFQWLGGKVVYQNMSEDIATYVYSILPSVFSQTQTYTAEALDIEQTLQSKMGALSPTAFEGFLRPIFKADEWKLILVGTVLGGLAGLFQLLLLNFV